MANLRGTPGNDVLTGGIENDLIQGLAGNDVLNGAGGSDRLEGGGGIDRLDGGAGNDRMLGGAGNDTYVVDSAGDIVEEASSQGTDTVEAWISYTLTANVENLSLSGSAANATGNSRANVLTGNAGANILNGLTGADTMIGGSGNDTYHIDNSGDIVTEFAGGGIDTVISNRSYTLGAELENLQLTGTAVRGTGNSAANFITGNASNNTLEGLDGNDTLDGGSGNDTMRGGNGNDIYYVNTIGDIVSEAAGQGGDEVVSSISYTLGANVEFLELTGSAFEGRGNDLDNHLHGNDGNNLLYGGAGNDLLRGHGGIDYMEGGSGHDIYLVDDLGEQVVEGVDEGYDTVVSSVSFTLGANLDRLDLTGEAFAGRGNSLDNLIIGNTIGNVIDAGDGNDRVYSDYGDDEVHGDGGNDIVDGEEGDDQLFGDAGDDLIQGSEGNDRLNGGDGTDVLYGGTGDDIFTVNDTGDTLTEYADEGVDTVHTSVASYTLGANIENYAFVGAGAATGIGNELDNHMSGAGELQGLDGNDTLVGGDDFSYLQGGAGNDVIHGGGERDGLHAGDGDDLVFGDEGRDTLSGAAGNDILDGGTDNDYYLGGTGDDRYIIDSWNEEIWEYDNEGVDTVESHVDVQWLAHNVENLELVGFGLTGHGNHADNVISGGRELWGEGGDDTLHGSDDFNLLYGGGNDDTLYGEGNDDNLEGMEGDDLLIGGDGNDYIQGQEGFDVLEGGAGFNTLIGGANIDRFVFEHEEWSGQYDRVLFADLGGSGDLFDFSRLGWVGGGAVDTDHFRLSYGHDQYGWVYTSIEVDLDGSGRDHGFYEVAQAAYVEMTYDDLANFIV